MVSHHVMVVAQTIYRIVPTQGDYAHWLRCGSASQYHRLQLHVTWFGEQVESAGHSHLHFR